MDVALPAFARCLRLMPNLRTIRVLDANPQMPNIIRKAFADDFPLLGVRTLIIPAVCHELLKRCPNVERVWCNQGAGNKLLTVIRGFCKQVVEVKGFRCEENIESMKRALPPTSQFSLPLSRVLTDFPSDRVGQRIAKSRISGTKRPTCHGMTSYTLPAHHLPTLHSGHSRPPCRPQTVETSGHSHSRRRSRTRRRSHTAHYQRGKGYPARTLENKGETTQVYRPFP